MYQILSKNIWKFMVLILIEPLFELSAKYIKKPLGMRPMLLINLNEVRYQKNKGQIILYSHQVKQLG